MEFIYKPYGVCSKEIKLEIENNIIQNVEFIGGCQGNLKAISRLIKGRSVQEVIEMLSGIECGVKGTSCADQLTFGLKDYLEKTIGS